MNEDFLEDLMMELLGESIDIDDIYDRLIFNDGLCNK
jgi:hypothetical protein